jgi:hypothetical protein
MAASRSRKGGGTAHQLADLWRSANGALEIPVFVAGEHQAFKAMAALAALVFIDRHDSLLVPGSKSMPQMITGFKRLSPEWRLRPG